MSQYPATFNLSSLDGSNGFRIDGEAPGDYLGRSVSLAGDINNDGLTDLVVGAPRSDPNGDLSGAAYVVFGRASGFDATFDLGGLDGSDGFQLNGEASLHPGGVAGAAVASAGDVNGDGVDDVIVGAFGVHYDAGAAYVVFGKTSGFDPTLELSALDGTNGFRVYGQTVGTRTGESVASAGDINGDGYDDLAIGAHGAQNGIGATYVVFGAASGFGPELDLSGLDGDNGFRINGEAAGDHSGYSVAAAGDVNGDGIDDLVVGAHLADLNGSNAGAAYVVFGTVAGFDPTLALTALDGSNGFRIAGESAGDYLGGAVAGAGDINADGLADIIVGAFGADVSAPSTGASYVVFGRASFDASLDLAALDGNNGFQINGEKQNQNSGAELSSAGDFNGDGFDDLFVAARGSAPPCVIFGKASGFTATMELTGFDGNNGFVIHGITSGSSVSSGDTNGDGFDDLALGWYGADYSGTNSGSSAVIFGAMPREAVERTGTDIANTIRGGNFDDTLDGLGGGDELYGNGGDDALYGDGGRDILFGAKGNDTFIGGAEADLIYSRPGHDRFAYDAASDSTGPSFDTIRKCDFERDSFDLPDAVTGIDAVIAAGRLHRSDFDSDLAAAADAAHLGAGHAVLFTPDAGNLRGNTFLAVDMNGTAGYQSGEDLVVMLANAKNLASLGVEDFV
jgi:hypothetical protein